MPNFTTNLGDIIFYFLHGAISIIHNSDLHINCKVQSIVIHFFLRILVFIRELGRKKIKVVAYFSALTACTKRKPAGIGNIMFLEISKIYQETSALTSFFASHT